MTSDGLTRRRFLGLAVAATAAAGLAACTKTSDAINLVGYSVAKSVYDAVQPAFAKTSAGKGVTFQSSYGASGDQSRQVVNGLAADYVAFSLAPDVTRLVDAKLVDSTWADGATKGMVSNSVVVIAVRKGNPLGIKGWDDIVKSGVKIVTPNPGSSGAARWNVLGAYAHGLANGGASAGEAFAQKFFDNIVSLPASGREATSTFTSGTGDVLISYENEAILARQSGTAIDYIVPEDSFLIQNPVAVTKTAPDTAKAFLAYVLSNDGQRIFVEKGFRPVVDGVSTSGVTGANDGANPFPTVSKLTTVDDLGGWTKINAEFFADDGLVTKLQKAKGLG